MKRCMALAVVVTSVLGVWPARAGEAKVAPGATGQGSAAGVWDRVIPVFRIEKLSPQEAFQRLHDAAARTGEAPEFLYMAEYPGRPGRAIAMTLSNVTVRNVVSYLCDVAELEPYYQGRYCLILAREISFESAFIRLSARDAISARPIPDASIDGYFPSPVDGPHVTTLCTGSTGSVSIVDIPVVRIVGRDANGHEMSGGCSSMGVRFRVMAPGYKERKLTLEPKAIHLQGINDIEIRLERLGSGGGDGSVSPEPGKQPSGTNDAAAVVSESPEQTEAAMIEMLRSGTSTNVQENARAMRLLGEMRSTNAIPVLLKHVTMDDPSTHSYPAWTALCSIGTNAVSALREFVLKADPKSQIDEIVNVGGILREIVGDLAADRWALEHRDKISVDAFQALMYREYS